MTDTLVIQSKQHVQKISELNAKILDKQRQNNSEFLNILGRHDPSLQNEFAGRCKHCGEFIESHVDAIEAHSEVCRGSEESHNGASAKHSAGPRRGQAGNSQRPTSSPGPSNLQVLSHEGTLRSQLASLFQVLDRQSWDNTMHTHISVRMPKNPQSKDTTADQTFLANPHGLKWSEVTPSSLVKVHCDGTVVDAGSAELGIHPTAFGIHGALHANLLALQDSSMTWVVHVHVPEVIAAACSSHGLVGGISQHAMALGRIEYLSYAEAVRADASASALFDAALRGRSQVGTASHCGTAFVSFVDELLTRIFLFFLFDNFVCRSF